MPHEVTQSSRRCNSDRSFRFPKSSQQCPSFPYIFRGALDVRARDITQGMKMAATKALAALAKEPVPDYIAHACSGEEMQ